MQKIELVAKLRGVSVEEAKRQLASAGKIGGTKSRRKLTKEQAIEMNRKSQETKRRKKLGSQAEG